MTDEHKQSLMSLGQQYTNYPVKLTMGDGQEFESIIEYVDENYLYVMYPVDEHDQPLLLSQIEGYEATQNRQFGYGYPYYGYPPHRPRPYGWRRWILPLTALAAIVLL
ncbi:hypothetical protein [Shouchella lonarensis]|uniref:Uncharacterized protein n=1 Tax=Shouchella lonarensis TaxID=1464122 RepID=A0A1G6JVR2_9BACI|nr:hypothetical protein [Shouchella lonarensis]SDC22721.1 hypothetical protein SAMN05421737_106105 [Shouchella lonarensis]